MIIKYNNKVVSNNSKWVSYAHVDPYNPLNLPANTIRLKFNSGVTPSYSKGTMTQVSTSPNVWDLTYNNTDWSELCHKTNGVTSDIIEVLGANTSGVTKMGGMFVNQQYLTNMALYDTSSVTDMAWFAYGCSRLTSVPLYDTSNVTDMHVAFRGCASITSIAALNTSKVTDMAGMLYNCNKLTTVPLFNTSNATDMSSMLMYCSGLTSIPQFNTSKCTNMSQLFYYCDHITSVPLIDCSKATNTSEMFYGCSALTSIPLLDLSSSIDTHSMFYGCGLIETLPLFDTSASTNMASMFGNCSSVSAIPLFDTSVCTNMNAMFDGCINVQSGALALYQQASTQTNPPTSHNYTFRNCGSNTQTGSAELSQIPLSWGGTNYGFNEVTIQTQSGNQTWTDNITQLSTPSYMNVSDVTANNYNMGTQHYYRLSNLQNYIGYEQYNDYTDLWVYYPPSSTLANGYHFPTKTEITALLASHTVSDLKSLYGWNTNNGSDTVDFNAMPTGYGQSPMGFNYPSATDTGNSFRIFCIDDELLANHYTYDSEEQVYIHDDQVSDYHVVKLFNIFDDSTYSFTAPISNTSTYSYGFNIRLIKN